MTVEILIALMLFTLLGVTYVMGFDIVRKRLPQYLPQYCLAMTVVRLVVAGSYAGVVIYLKENRSEAIPFALIYIIMYIVMMVVTLILRH